MRIHDAGPMYDEHERYHILYDQDEYEALYIFLGMMEPDEAKFIGADEAKRMYDLRLKHLNDLEKEDDT